MNTIISKRTTPFVYTAWYTDPKKNICQAKYSIVVNGGAGSKGGAELMSGLPMAQRSLFTPEGVATLVNDDTLEKLMEIPKFKSDIKRGLIIVRKGEKIQSQDKIDNIAEKEMLEGDHIPTRPISEDDIRSANAKVTEDDDGNQAVDVSKLDGSPVDIRNSEAGLTSEEKKRRRRRRGEKKGIATAAVIKR